MEMAGSLKVVLLVFQLLYFIVSGEEWFSNMPSHSNTPYEVLKHHLKTFDTKGIKTGHYSVLSVDQQNNHLLVGAMNAAILVDLNHIDSYVLWNVTTPSSGNMCDKEKDFLCNSFIAVMLPFKDRIFLCWTGPSAACSWRNRTNLKEAPGRDSLGNVFESDVKDVSPSGNPYENDTAVITERGTLFRGKSNRDTRNSIIYGRRFNPSLIQTTFSSYRQSQRWFYYDAEFLKSFDIGLYVYFFFRERSLECKSCGNQVFSRVARICKGDYGGYFSLKNIFVTFQKAKLSCSDGKDYAVNFNEIQDVWWNASTNLFHAIFTSHRNGPPASAICIYSLSSIERIFVESKFKTYNDERVWATVDNKYPEYFPNCKVNPRYIEARNRPSVPDGMMATQRMTIEAYTALNHDPLMEEPVKPTSSRAWFIKDGIRMTAIALDKVGANIVVYASTDRGTVLKISQPVERDQPCLITEMDVFPVGKREVIRAMALDTHRHVLYVGSSTKLSKLSLEQCSSYLDESSCISAADPYCGWDNKTKRCVSFLSYGKPSELKQNLSSCPKAKEVSWSPWKNCLQNDGNLCRCQVRPCQGKTSSCEGGLEYNLENCTVDITVGWEGEASWEALGVQHGSWSVWGNWSECSAKAWAGVRKRSRTCTNPVPRRGGRPCLGDAVQYEPCSLRSEEVEKSLSTNLIRVLNPNVNVAVRFHVKCKANGYKLTDVSAVLTNQTVDCEKESQTCGDGEWETWGEWSQCTFERFQIRRRKCKQQPCVGERLQERNCSTPPTNCKSVQQMRDDSNETAKSNFRIGHVIGAAVTGCVFTILLFVAAIYFVNRKKKQQLNVSKEIGNNIHEAGNGIHEEGNESRYSTLPLKNGEPLENVELLKDPRTPGYKDKNKSQRVKTPSPLKIIWNKRKQKLPVERYPEEEV